MQYFSSVLRSTGGKIQLRVCKKSYRSVCQRCLEFHRLSGCGVDSGLTHEMKRAAVSATCKTKLPGCSYFSPCITDSWLPTITDDRKNKHYLGADGVCPVLYACHYHSKHQTPRRPLAF